MRIKIVARNFEVNDKLRDLLDKKIRKLDKYFGDETLATLTLKKQKEICKMEMMFSVGNSFIRSEVSGDNMYDNIDLLLPKVEKQILKHKTKLKSKLKAGALDLPSVFEQKDTDESVAVIAKTKTFAVTPMSVEEAAAALDLIGHDFFLYEDEKSKKLSVIYRRDDGTYGLLIPE